MKTFLYSIPNRIQSFSKKLDVKTALCGKSWEVFNDEGVKQLFIFNENGSILITNNGKVINASWSFIPQNSSILITTGDETIMFRTAFFNKVLIVLQQDGVERYLFMIDESKEALFPDMSLATLTEYVEREIAAAALLEKQKQLKAERAQEEREREEINKQQLKEAERVLIMGYIKSHKDEIQHEMAIKKRNAIVCAVLCIVLLTVTILARENAFLGGLFAIAFISALAAEAIIIGTTPLRIIGRNLENGVRYHDEFEVQKLYEEL